MGPVPEREANAKVARRVRGTDADEHMKKKMQQKNKNKCMYRRATKITPHEQRTRKADSLQRTTDVNKSNEF